MRLEEQMLLRFCKDKQNSVSVDDYASDSLKLLREVFPNFLEDIKGKAVCDFGCGLGNQSMALAKAGARHVFGMDTNAEAIAQARAHAGQCPNIEFATAIEGQHRAKFDVVISQNSMEHFPNPKETLEVMVSLLKDSGALLITFGPPWFAPYGAHMQFFTNLPWVHLIFSEKAVMAVRSRYRTDGAKRYEEVKSGLNKMSIRKFRRIIKDSGMKIVFGHYKCIKGFDFLGKIPSLRELFINHVTVRLVKR